MEEIIKSFDGTRISNNYFKGGDTAIVFLHGVGGNWTMWKEEIDFFKKKGFTVIAPDLRGHGQSDTPEEFEKYQINFFTRDVHKLINRDHIKHFILVGHSLGGGIALDFCLRYPKSLPKALVLIETASTYPFDHNRLLNYGPYLTKFLRFIASHESLLEKHYHHLKDVDLSCKGVEGEIHLISHLLHLTPLKTIVKTLDCLEEHVFKNQGRIDKNIGSLKIPLLLIAGEKDKIIPIGFSKLIKKLYHGKRAQLKILKGQGHAAIVEDADDVCKLIYHFIQKEYKIPRSDFKGIFHKRKIKKHILSSY